MEQNANDFTVPLLSVIITYRDMWQLGCIVHFVWVLWSIFSKFLNFLMFYRHSTSFAYITGVYLDLIVKFVWKVSIEFQSIFTYISLSWLSITVVSSLYIYHLHVVPCLCSDSFSNLRVCWPFLFSLLQNNFGRTESQTNWILWGY